MEASFKSRADQSQGGGTAGVHRRPLTGSTALGKGRKESEGCRKRRKNGWRRRFKKEKNEKKQKDGKDEEGDSGEDEECDDADGHDDHDGHDDGAGDGGGAARRW